MNGNGEMTSGNVERKLFGYWPVLLVVFFIAAVVSFFTYIILSNQRLSGNSNDLGQLNERAKTYDSAIDTALFTDQSPIQNLFLNDLRNGTIDKFSRSAAYFITHRFFDNGGNIYEIYDFVNSNPELSFIQKEAEAMFPKTFSSLKDENVKFTPFSYGSYYVYLAYTEVLYRHGYTDIAAVGTLANQYAKLAYMSRMIAKELPDDRARLRTRTAERDTIKAIEFVTAADSEIDKILNGEITGDEIEPRDILVGMNQYSSALRYLEALRLEGYVSSSSLRTDALERSKKVFDLAMEYSRKNVPVLAIFTSLLNASTLAMIPTSTQEEVRGALFTLLDVNPRNVNPERLGVIKKVLDSRFQQEPKNKEDTDLDIYGKRNILRLAEKVPEFKQWLIRNGWTEEDFVL